MAITHNLTLDVHKRTSRIPPEVVVRQGEAGTETIVASITKDGEAYTSGLSSVRLDILHADGTWARVTGTKSGSTVTVTLPSAALSSHGLCKLAHLVFFDASNADVESTEGFLLRILQAVDGSGQGSQDYDDRLDALYKKWLAYEREAEASESARVSAEAGRVGAEASRAGAESARAGNETARVSAETGRATAEGTRQAKEAERQAAEAARAAAEGKRASVETSRASAEAARADAETARVATEKRRETDQARNNADQAANNAAAQGLLVELVAEGGYDPSTLEPTADGKVGTLYLVPDPKASGDNAYAEWMWVNGKWERVGSSNATVAGLTTEQVDAVASGGTVTSENVVNGSVLTYLWAKLRAAFAAIGHKHSVADVTGLQTALDGKAASSHTHNASDVTSGALSIAHGGTGAATAAAARTSLGAASAADLAKVRDSVSRTVTVDDRLAGSSVWCDTHLSQRVCLTARTADRARGYALVASDTSIFLYDLDAQKPIWAMRAQQSPIYFSSVDSFSLTVTAPHDCVIEVEAWFECQWGYGGGEASLSISTPAGLDSMCAVAGRVRGGDTVGRSLHAFGAFSGAKGGATYTFACSLNGSGTGGSKNMIARCFPA